MSIMSTAQSVEAMTDQGQFELLATAILREAVPMYRSLVHLGVNPAGKTVKAPLDGICFVQGAAPPHMIAVHHTITALDNLENKWLHDPSTVQPRAGSRPTAPAGDLIKTAQLVAEERIRTANLRVTLVLTTNEEPGQALVRAVFAAGREREVEIDLWPRSRLSHFLDNDPTGQWIRWSFLRIEQELLSPELLDDLSKKSVDIHRPPGDPLAWIPRSLDATLTTGLRSDVTFLVAGSGLGKSVACYRRLAAHVGGGGFGIVLSDEIIASALTLDQAIAAALRQLHPSLVSVGPSALSLSSLDRPLILVVEDINRSGQPRRLVEKLAGWSHRAGKEHTGTSSTWRLICPIWPEVLTSLGDQVRKHIDPLTTLADGFTEGEGRDAVLARARLEGRELSSLSAGAISGALGHDPLLIALHDSDRAPDPHQVIGQFVEGSLSRTAESSPIHPPTDYRQALRALAGEMLANRQIELSWRKIRSWAGLQGRPLDLVGRIAHQGELMRLAGPSDNQRLLFRHDRVRDWLLADAAAELSRQDLLTAGVLAEPYYAEVIGSVLAWTPPAEDFLQRVSVANPLALFHAFRILTQAGERHCDAIVQSIHNWLDEPATSMPSRCHLRWEALAVLADTDSPEVPAIVRRLPDRTFNASLALLRNGDVTGGIVLCDNIDPGTAWPLRDAQIAHARLHHGPRLIADLRDTLLRPDVSIAVKTGALRLAGHFADPALASAIAACWAADDNRVVCLQDYLWASAECCGADPSRFLDAICDAWAALPNHSTDPGHRSPRSALASDGVSFGFRRCPPRAAIAYFVGRASQQDLAWPITVMLSGIDDAGAVSLVVQQFATHARATAGTDSYWPFPPTVVDDWRRAQEDYGRPMSPASRQALLALWRDRSNDKHLRQQAFYLWAATHDADDLEVLRAVHPSDDLADSALEQRLRRGDQQAIPAMIERITLDERGFWWQSGRHIWSPDLTEALSRCFERRSTRVALDWNQPFESDWITHEMVIRLPASDAERLLLTHWDHLRFSRYFVQAALYVATEPLVKRARASIEQCPEPATLLKHLSFAFGLRVRGRCGLTREAQIRALEPFLDLLSTMDIGALWDECNDHGWFAIRQELLDDRLQPPDLDRKWDNTRVESQLDDMAVQRHFLWIGHWIDRFLRTGVPWSEIITTMMQWLDRRRSLDALRVVAEAVTQRGSRADMSRLRSYENVLATEAHDVLEDAQFAVCRRSIR